MRVSTVFVFAALALGVSAQPVDHSENQPMHTNRLAGETSPYLLQHAHNPVDWYPWGEEAFAEARRRDVPIFVSIGYSTCYWCHVMERESFEDEATAKVMNEHYVCIKVDREERPDIDDIYMAATQAMTGRGGWPMSVWLEPEHLRPFYCGTYFPPTERQGMPSFKQVLLGIAQVWDTKRADILTQSESLADAVREQLGERETPVVVDAHEVEAATAALMENFDPTWGGFGGAPKFPQPTYLDFLLAVRESGDETTRNGIDSTIRTTLDKMFIGGVFDQVGGGFHRYSVDGQWTVPHFEKMLYDQGQLASTYARASATFGDAEYRRVAEQICGYVLREMTSPEGAFYSAQDAEVDGREGQNYLWTLDELRHELGEDDAAFAADVYSVAEGPNFRDPHHPDETPSNVLRLSARPEQVAERLGMDIRSFHARLDAINATLYTARLKRKQPRTDDKILAGWNGLMIGGLAEVGAMSGDGRYVDAAARAAAFIDEHMRDADGQLLRTFRGGIAKTPAFFEDYAYLEAGLIALHRAQRVLGESGDASLQLAIRLADEAQVRFGDEETGGYFDTPVGQSDLFVRPQSVYDGAISSATSVHLNALLDLALITGDDRFAERAVRGLVATSAAIKRSPVGVVNATRALYRALKSGMDLAAAFSRADAKPGNDDTSVPPVASPVEIFAEVDRVSVSKDEPAALTLRLRVADGYHIVAADPGEQNEDFVIPLRVSVAGGTGISVYADYPAGKEYRVEGVDGALLVNEGEFELPIVLERTGDVSGRPMILVTYQACSESECLAPVTVELDVALDFVN